VISEAPFDQKLFQSYVDGRPVAVAFPESAAAAAIAKLAESVLDFIKEIEVYPRHSSTTTPHNQYN
jgi:MinD-like ATPase involved in chromosome partitioning or flagellar assembly